ncbi:DnaD domain protein [Staphylospora marina]|uniref:DnaD domain protein n=1 Tax=Staphylospora marina TaxID=2490858 RepID=UPI000F5BF8DC|nr:DnaD domain protein [Staphylospora marina]
MDRKESLQASLVRLLEQGSVSIPLLLFTEYKRVGLTEAQTMLLLHIWVFQEKEQKSFPTVAELNRRMSISQDEMVNLLEQLVRGGFLSIEEEVDERGVLSERYSLSPLFMQLVASHLDRDEPEEDEKDERLYRRLFTLFEQEFARALSPLECQMLARWIDEDKYPEELIEAALREAVFCGKLNFRYIDRILFEWEKNGIRTTEEAAEHSRRFRQKGILYQGQVREREQAAGSFSFYNWVKPK